MRCLLVQTLALAVLTALPAGAAGKPLTIREGKALPHRCLGWSPERQRVLCVTGFLNLGPDAGEWRLNEVGVDGKRRVLSIARRPSTDEATSDEELSLTQLAERERLHGQRDLNVRRCARRPAPISRALIPEGGYTQPPAARRPITRAPDTLPLPLTVRPGSRSSFGARRAATCSAGSAGAARPTTATRLVTPSTDRLELRRGKRWVEVDDGSGVNRQSTFRRYPLGRRHVLIERPTEHGEEG